MAVIVALPWEVTPTTVSKVERGNSHGGLLYHLPALPNGSPPICNPLCFPNAPRGPTDPCCVRGTRGRQMLLSRILEFSLYLSYYKRSRSPTDCHLYLWNQKKENENTLPQNGCFTGADLIFICWTSLNLFKVHGLNHILFYSVWKQHIFRALEKELEQSQWGKWPTTRFHDSSIQEGHRHWGLLSSCRVLGSIRFC